MASDTPPVKEAMVDGETGMFVDFFDQVSLVEKTCQLLDGQRYAKNWERRHVSISLINTI